MLDSIPKLHYSSHIYYMVTIVKAMFGCLGRNDRATIGGILKMRFHELVDLLSLELSIYHL